MKHFLIIVDMQNDFVDAALGTAEAAAIVPAVVDRIRAFDGEIIATMDTHQSDYLETREGRFLPVPHCIRGTEGWALNPSVREALEQKKAIVIEKGTFGSTRLPALLEERAAGEEFDVELIGLCTDICVVSNALLVKAAFPEADIAVTAACCAGVTPAKHEAALETMRSCQITVQ